ncbi:metallo-beta-lactamase family protein [Microvirga guangxiensis]|uniref:Metallo-beta-lactamase family protein n=1 Tax=Microvirga guangxiensis TaxID=549386 RepID=A0A1G5BSR8_9HYPH|nr:MBL fold metallo-hydrolase [Microvirga guangxiensis]SCX92960.1 metallo-beta-lactamase family protein [Microvirga guangxiensis]
MSLRLHFYGAARTVTGSCFLLETDATRVLVDCGMFQGSKTERELNYQHFPFRAAGISALCLTHAHIDHSGLVPKLVKAGFDGPIYATAGTVDLASIMLPDSGYIQEAEVNQLNRRNSRRGLETVSPIYTQEDAIESLEQFQPVAYGQWRDVAPGFRARYWNAGHLLGSASIEIEVASEGGEKPTRLLFSGDIGPDHKLLQPDPDGPRDLDYVILESTYGDTDRDATTIERRRRMLRDEVRAAMHPSGVLLIPSFAVERTQELLVDLMELMEAGELPDIPVFIDSPLASKASAIFKRHAKHLRNGSDLVQALESRWVRFTETVEQSKSIDRIHSFHIIIAASGMCEAGRIRHHLKAWLWRDEATVLFVGFQAQGTLGRILQDGASKVRIHGDEIKVRARMRTLDLYSGHADQPELKAWLTERLPVRRGVFLVHGEDPALKALQSSLADLEHAPDTLIPEIDDVFDLTGDRAVRIDRAQPRMPGSSAGHRDWHNDYAEMLLEINDAVEAAADRKSKGVIIRRIRDALKGETMD